MNYWDRAKREKDGVPFTVPSFPEWTFYVRRFGMWASHYHRAVARIAAKPENAERIKARLEPGYERTKADTEHEEIMSREAFAEGCIAGWDGVTNEFDVDLVFSPERAAEVLAAFPEIYHELMKFSADAKNFEPPSTAEKEALALGNLPPASNSSTVRGGSTSGSSQAPPRGERARRR